MWSDLFDDFIDSNPLIRVTQSGVDLNHPTLDMQHNPLSPDNTLVCDWSFKHNVVPRIPIVKIL